MSLLLQLGVKAHSLLQAETGASTSGTGHVDVPLVEDVLSHHHVPHSYTSCFGLPYQDHNYGAPPPPTPPVSPRAPTPPAPVLSHIDIDDVSCHTTVVTTTPDEPDIVTPEDSVTRCICEFQHDDGYMICCDRCGVWQHVDCMGVDRLNIPDIFYCEKCEPRKVDKHRAIQIQTKRRELLMKLDSSATDTEDETPQGKKKKKDKAKQKKVRKENNKSLPLKGHKVKLGPGKQKERETRKSFDISPLNLNNKKKNQTSPLSQKKKRHGKSPKRLSLEEVPPQDSSPRGAWSPDSSLQNGMLSPTLASSSSSLAAYRESGSYQDAPGNLYSIDIETLLVGNKLNGQHGSQSARGDGGFPGSLNTRPQLLVQLCTVENVTPSHQGLEALEDIATNQPIVEYRGMVMLREQFIKENSFYSRSHPHVLFYKFDDLHVCVDATKLGTDGRHIRRSCVPNCEIHHLVENGNLLFFIYSSRCISRGSELTIPFDFNHRDCSYHVECACSRQSCHIAKRHRNEENRTTPARMVRKRRRRSTKSEEGPGPVADTPPVATSTPVSSHSGNKHQKAAGSATKRRKMSSVSESTAPNDQAAPRPEPKPSPPKTRAREDSTSKSESSLSRLEKSHGEDSEDHNTTEGSMTQEDKAKMASITSREERKMDAILKAFEKMEKREERRKEALARIDTTRKSDDGKQSPDTSSSTKKLDQKQPQQQGETTEDDTKPDHSKSESKLKKGKSKGKKRMIIPARRAGRTSSSLSASMSNMDSGTSADESSSLVTPALTPVPSSAEPGSTSITPSCTNYDKAFRFPKTKKYRLNEWLQESGQEIPRPLSIRTDLSDIDSEETEFVKCVPSPHANSLNHLRRNSLSAVNREVHTKVLGSAGSQIDTQIGSAKKRWLRQAMHEHTGPAAQFPTETSMSPIQSGGTSPNLAIPGSGSPGTSPLDFVTPLKKRRLARESVSSESPYPGVVTLSPYTSIESMDLISRLEEDEEDIEDRVVTRETVDPSLKSYLLEYSKAKNGIQAHATANAVKQGVFERLKRLAEQNRLLDKQNSVDIGFSNSVTSPPAHRTLHPSLSERSVSSDSDLDNHQVRVGLAVLDNHQVRVGPAVLDNHQVGPTDLDNHQVRVGPAVLDNHHMRVGPEILDNHYMRVGPTVLDNHQVGPAIKHEVKVEEQEEVEHKVKVENASKLLPAVKEEPINGVVKYEEELAAQDSKESLDTKVEVPQVKSEVCRDSSEVNSLPGPSTAGNLCGVCCCQPSGVCRCKPSTDSDTELNCTGSSDISSPVVSAEAQEVVSAAPSSSDCKVSAADRPSLEDSIQPSSSSDQQVTSVESKCTDCNSLQSFSLKLHQPNSAHESYVDSSQGPLASSSWSKLAPDCASVCVDTVSPHRQEECDSTNRDFEGSRRGDHSEVAASSSCSSSESDTKENELRKSCSHSELSSSSELAEANDVEGTDSKAAHSSELPSQQELELHSQVVASSDMDQCSSSYNVDMISNTSQRPVADSAADQSQAQSGCASSALVSTRPASSSRPLADSVADSAADQSQAQSGCASSALVSTRPASSSRPREDLSEGELYTDNTLDESSALDNSLSEVDSTQPQQCSSSSIIQPYSSPRKAVVCSTSSSRKEEGELDSSDMENQQCPAQSSEAGTRATTSALVDESEKEEGEITDDETEEEGNSVSEQQPPTSSSTSPVPVSFSGPVTSTETAPSSSISAIKSSSSDLGPTSPSSSSSFRRSVTSTRESDWGTPYRGSSNISSSSNGAVSRRDRYSEYHRHSSSSSSSTVTTRNLHDKHSPSLDADSSCCERTRHPSDDANFSFLDSNISSTGFDQTEDSWRQPESPHDSNSPISSSGLNLLPPKKKVSLTEYKKRMKQKRPETGRNTTSSGRNSASNSGRTTPCSKEAHNNNPDMTPLMPYFGTLGSSLATKDKVPLPSAALTSLKDSKEETDVHWNSQATAAELIREQTQLSLTERLRREFGLDASESEEDEERKRESDSDDQPPPPPPPAPVCYGQQVQYTMLPHPLSQSQPGPPGMVPHPPHQMPPPHGIPPPPSLTAMPPHLGPPPPMVLGPPPLHSHMNQPPHGVNLLPSHGGFRGPLLPTPGQHPGGPLPTQAPPHPSHPIGPPPHQGPPPPHQGLPPPQQGPPPLQGPPPHIQGPPPPHQPGLPPSHPHSTQGLPHPHPQGPPPHHPPPQVGPPQYLPQPPHQAGPPHHQHPPGAPPPHHSIPSHPHPTGPPLPGGQSLHPPVGPPPHQANGPPMLPASGPPPPPHPSSGPHPPLGPPLHQPPLQPQPSPHLGPLQGPPPLGPPQHLGAPPLQRHPLPPHPSSSLGRMPHPPPDSPQQSAAGSIVPDNIPSLMSLLSFPTKPFNTLEEAPAPQKPPTDKGKKQKPKKPKKRRGGGGGGGGGGVGAPVSSSETASPYNGGLLPTPTSTHYNPGYNKQSQ